MDLQTMMIFFSTQLKCNYTLNGKSLDTKSVFNQSEHLLLFLKRIDQLAEFCFQVKTHLEIKPTENADKKTLKLDWDKTVAESVIFLLGIEVLAQLSEQYEKNIPLEELQIG